MILLIGITSRNVRLYVSRPSNYTQRFCVIRNGLADSRRSAARRWYSAVSGRSCIVVCTALHRCCAPKCIKSPAARHSSYARRLCRRDVLRRAIHHDQLQRHSAISSLYRTNTSLISAPLDGTPFGVAYNTETSAILGTVFAIILDRFLSAYRICTLRYDTTLTDRRYVTDMWTIT